jgi:hypothetical protein
MLSAANIQAMVRLRDFIVWEQARMALRDMEHNRYRLEQGKIAYFLGRNLPERMKC